MKYSDRIEKAICVIGEFHKGQKRKGSVQLPYITHLFSVALIVSNYTNDEDIIIAALLHDTLEDTEYTEEKMLKDFGAKVRNIVVGVTEPKNAKSWGKRKKGYITGLKSAPTESLLVASADKIHNFASILIGYKEVPSSFLKEFSGTVETRIEFYEEIIEIIKSKLKSPIVKKLEKVFSDYKFFLRKI